MNPILKIIEERKIGFKDRFKGWILQDNNEYYRSFEIIEADNKETLRMILEGLEKHLLGMEFLQSKKEIKDARDFLSTTLKGLSE